jgi:hypothetical protein
MNINKYTYNISNFLLRAGFGQNGLWFLNIPVIKELSKRQNAINGQLIKHSNKPLFDLQEEIFDRYKQELYSAIPQEILSQKIHLSEQAQNVANILKIDTSIKSALDNSVYVSGDDVAKALNIDLNDEAGSLKNILLCESIAADINYAVSRKGLEKEFLDDMVVKLNIKDVKEGKEDPTKSFLYSTVKGIHNDGSSDLFGKKRNIRNVELYNYIALFVFDGINKNEAKITSDLTKFSKIDTKKHGSTIAAQLDF